MDESFNVTIIKPNDAFTFEPESFTIEPSSPSTIDIYVTVAGVTSIGDNIISLNITHTGTKPYRTFPRSNFNFFASPCMYHRHTCSITLFVPFLTFLSSSIVDIIIGVNPIAPALGTATFSTSVTFLPHGNVLVTPTCA
jgi:hypothetical protein